MNNSETRHRLGVYTSALKKNCIGVLDFRLFGVTTGKYNYLCTSEMSMLLMLWIPASYKSSLSLELPHPTTKSLLGCFTYLCSRWHRSKYSPYHSNGTFLLVKNVSQYSLSWNCLWERGNKLVILLNCLQDRLPKLLSRHKAISVLTVSHVRARQ